VNLVDDGLGVRGPDIRLRGLIAVFEMASHGGDERRNARDGEALQLLLGKLAEEALEHIEPGGTGRDEMEMDARIALEPRPDLPVLVGGVVQDDMQIQLRLDRGFQPLEELQELPVTVAGHALVEHFTGGDVQRSEKGRGAMALIVMVIAPARPFFSGRPGWVRSSACI